MVKKKQKKIKTEVIITGMCCITVLEIVALSNGIDGVLFATVIAAISGLAGWVLPTPRILK